MGLQMFDLTGKVAIVTGASRGLGQAMAVALAEAGADIAGVSSSGQFNEVESAVKQTGRRFCPVTADLSASSSIDEIVQQSRDHFGRIDILVNNAGITRRAPCLDLKESDWDDVLKVDLSSVFFLSQAVARVMIEQGSGGKIIHIASLLSFQGGILTAAYTAAKSGLAGVTKTMANEWACKGINVNAIAPGYFATRLTSPLQQDEARNQAILDRIPAGRWGEPEDLSGMVVFLASSASDYCHGSVYPVDGGWLGR